MTDKKRTKSPGGGRLSPSEGPDMHRPDYIPIDPPPVTLTGRTHVLESWPDSYEAIGKGIKNFEIRRLERPGKFRVGDILIFRKADDINCEIERVVIHVENIGGYRGPRCIMGLALRSRTPRSDT